MHLDVFFYNREMFWTVIESNYPKIIKIRHESASYHVTKPNRGI